MTDLTPTLNELLQPHNACTKGNLAYSAERIDAFLAEAYDLNARTAQLLSYLRYIRRPYLSTAPPPRRRLQQHLSISNGAAHESQPQLQHLTDADRESIDADSTAALSTLHASLKQLRAAEALRQSTAAELATGRRRKRRGVGGALGRWAMGGGIEGEDAESDLTPEEQREEGERTALAAHRDAVVWFLERGLEQCGRYQGEMLSVRVARELERGKSSLYAPSRGINGGGTAVPVWEPDAAAAAATAVLEEEEHSRRPTGEAVEGREESTQQALLERENQHMLSHLAGRQRQARAAEASLVEIGALQNQLAVSLTSQTAQIDQLLGDSLATADNVGSGNKELKRAGERKSTAKAVFWGTVVGCSVAIVWDFLI